MPGVSAETPVPGVSAETPAVVARGNAYLGDHLGYLGRVYRLPLREPYWSFLRLASVMRTAVLALGLLLATSGCTDGASVDPGEARAAQRPASAGAAPSPSPTPSGFVLSEVHRGCGPSDFVGVLGRVSAPSGLLDFDGLRVEVTAAGVVIGSVALETPDFIVYPKGGRELPDAAQVAVVRQDGTTLAAQQADLRFRPEGPPTICG